MSTKGKIKALATFALFVVSAGSLSAEAEPLTLEAALDRVESMNLRILIQQENIRQAAENIYRTRAALLPSLSVEASQTRNKVSNVGRGFGGGPDIGPENRFDALIRANIPIVDATAYADLRLARIDEEIANLNYDGLRQEVMEVVTTAYFTHMRNIERLNVIRANVERDTVLFELAQRQVEGGVGTQIDATRAEVQLSLDELDMERQETLILQSEQNLKAILDLDPDFPLVVEPNFDEIASVEAIIPSEQNPHILYNRPDYRQTYRELERNELARQAVDWRHLPRVSAFGEYGYATETALDGNEENQWAVGIAVSVSIFNGFRTRSDRHIAQSAIRQKRYELRDLERQYGTELRVAIRNAQSLQRQIDLVQKTVRLREAELELARQRFEQGVTDNSDVVTAQAAIAVANDDYVNSIYEYNLARAELARVQGNIRLLLK